MSSERRYALTCLLALTAFALATVGLFLFGVDDNGDSEARLAFSYSTLSVSLLGWLAYFGSKR